MGIIKAPQPIDLTPFQPDAANPHARYGLPEEVKFCKVCVISNQRPSSAVEHKHTINSKKTTIQFSEDGVCSACELARQKKHAINWEERDKELRDLCDRFRSKDGSYDCLVPGSGGKDSVYAAHILKNEYGMNPLTVTWAPHMYTDWGWKNFQSWIHSGFDNYLMTPNGRVHSLLTRLAVDKLFHPFQPFIFGQKSLAPKMALLFNIPLVFYGESGAEYGSPISGGQTAQREWSTFTAEDQSNLYLGGVSITELKEDFGLKDQDLIPYMPADPNRLSEKNIEVHQLGYYLKWHPQACYYYSVEHANFIASPERTPGTYSKYNSIDDKVDDFHYFTTGIKFGIGRSTYDAAQEVRSGDITREEAVALAKRFDIEFPERFAEEIFEYLSVPEDEYPIASTQFEQPIMDRDYFMTLADTFRSPHIWKHEAGEWQLRHAVWHEEAMSNVTLHGAQRQTVATV